jgi:hypothetical protein
MDRLTPDQAAKVGDALGPAGTRDRNAVGD